MDTLPVALGSLRGDAGLAWADRQGSAATLVPAWPASARMALLAARLDGSGEFTFHGLLAPEALDAVADLGGEARPVLYWAVPRSALLELIKEG